MRWGRPWQMHVSRIEFATLLDIDVCSLASGARAGLKAFTIGFYKRGLGLDRRLASNTAWRVALPLQKGLHACRVLAVW
jgi:hypothetical protein